MLRGQALIDEINGCRDGGENAFWWLGQMGFCFVLGGRVIYVDAFLDPGIGGRQVPPMVAAGELSNADFIVGTHDHIDHIDRAVWPELAVASPRARFVVANCLIPQLSLDLGIPVERFLGLDDGESVSDGGVAFTGIAAAHEFLDREPDGRYPHMCVGIRAGGRNLFHGGDTLVYDGLAGKIEALGPLDLMAVPINGRDGARYRRGCIGNMTFQEAADLAGRISPALVVPAHYDMFLDNGENPYRFVDYLEAKYPDQRLWTGGHGTMVRF